MTRAMVSGKLKVAHLITRLDLGGAQQNTLYTARHLDPERFSVVLLCGEGGILDAQARRLEEEGLRVRWIQELGRPVSPLRDAAAFCRLYAVLREEAPSIVHTHSSKAGILGRLAARAAGVPVVLHTFHGFGFHERQHPCVRRTYILLERLCARLSSALVFVSKANEAAAASLGLGRPERRVLIRSGVRLADFPAPLPSREDKKASLGAPRHKPLVVGVGNLKPQKNAMDFARCAERVLSECPEARFLYVGEGPLRPRLEAYLLARGLLGKVLLPGWRRDVPEILAAADVFLLTSLWEGLPRSLVEAMRTGLACVCYAADGVRDVLVDGENGYLVAPGDWGSAARRVIGLLGAPEERRRLGGAARASIGAEFDIDGMVRAQESLYARLASR